MSLITNQIEELRAYAKDRKGELAKLIADAADTIEVLSAKLHASQMERSSQYYHGGWIPCSERLPEKTQLCLVTEKTVVGFEVCTRCFNKRNDGGFWSGWGHTDVIAWMPLPEPYREEGEK